MGPFEVEAKHIEMLDPLQLSLLLKRLLYLEAGPYGIPFSAPHVPLEINVPDGGEDGRIKWDNGVERTDYVPKRFTIFQCKAKKVGPNDCKDEVRGEGGELKRQIKEVLDNGGAYVVFCREAYVETQIEKRIEGIREGIKDSGRSDYNNVYIDFYDGNKIAGWVNKYFAAQAYVFECNHIELSWSMKTWGEWAGHKDLQGSYISNEKIAGYIKAIREECIKKERAVIRITGLSGLGKTRMALEAFRGVEGSDTPADHILAAKVVYADGDSVENDILKFVCQLRKMGREGILVVDNCEPALHRRLSRELGYEGGHRISLVTLDFNPEEDNPEWRAINLKQEDCKGVVKGIVKGLFPGLLDSVVSRIEEFAQDFAGMAVLMGKQICEDVEDVGRISDKELVEKLLWGREGQDKEVVSVIQACSLFDYVEFSEETCTNDLEFLAKDIAGVAKEKFFAVCQKYLKRGIVQKRGRFIKVCPIPLAITMAAEWWESKPTNEVVGFIEKVGKAELLTRFCDQAKMLHFSKNAREVVMKLCGPQGPFGNPEALLSDEGSRLFRALVEVNPQATIEALWASLLGKSREELLKVKDDVRRNLVWALEKLCWWRETFEKAAKLLLRFGAAENERWGNNATEQFKQLFHLYLSGTQANLHDRIVVVREALASKAKEEQELGIRALGRALETDSFSRTGGVETQGSRVPGRDYEPTGQEIREYWQECIRLLREEILSEGRLGSKAKDELGTNIGSLVRNGMIREVEDTIETITNQGGPSWGECLTAIRRLLDYNGEDMPADIRARILHLESLLQPKSIREQLWLIVGIPDWRDKKDEKGDYVSIAAAEADELGRGLGGDNSWFKEARVIVEGEQRQGYAFGRALGQSMPAGLRREFIEVCLSILAELGREKGNPDVLGAFLGNVSDEDLVDETMERVIQDEKLCGYSVWISRFLEATKKGLQRLLPLVGENKIPVSDLRVLSYGRALDKLPEDFVAEFCQTIANHSQEGANCALDVLYMYCHQNDERFAKCVQTFRNIVMRKGLLVREKQSQMAGHNWEVVSKKLLKIDKDVELAKHLAGEIVRMCGSKEISWNIVHYNARGVLATLLKEYFDTCWNIVGETLVSKDWQARRRLGNIVGAGHEKEKSEALIAEISQEGLLKWCKKNIPLGPAAIAHLTPVFPSDKGKVSLHPLARRVIDDFGSFKEVREELSSNLWSFSSWGSRAPYYQRRIDLLRELTAHPIKEVGEWAKSNIKWFEKERDEATRESQEWEWGIH